MTDELQELLGTQKQPEQQQSSGQSWLKIFGIVVVACVVSTLVALCAVYFYLFPGPFKPVALSTSEEQVLEQKLEQLDSTQRSRTLHKGSAKGQKENGMQPERYTETDANREIILTERELNGLLAKNTDLASQLAIDLSQDLASAKLLIPLDEEFPLLGGKTLKVTAGLELAYRDKNPVVSLRGISLWGVPIPNAWLGNIKNVDLVQEFGDQKGFWSAFADGIDEVEVSDGQLRVKLKE
jgi:hypothetical protein